MQPLPPIPSPPGHLWREFCVRGLPYLMFIAACGAAAVLWQYQGGGRSLLALGEGPRAAVASPQAGRLVQLLVQPYAQVRAGTPLAVVRLFDPRADLDLLRSRLDLLRLRNTPTLTEESAVAVERLRLELLRTQTEIAVERVRLELSESNLVRSESLFHEGLLAREAYDLSRTTRDIHRAEIAEKEQAVNDMQARLDVLSGPVAESEMVSTLTHLEESQHSVATNWGPITLFSPIDGVVSAPLRQPGEYVADGEPVLMVQGEWADRIVGYLRQPFSFDPVPGLNVVVAMRSMPRKRFTSEILHVGPQFEMITNSLAWLREGATVDVGLPIVMAIPPGIHIRSGETVDVLIRSASDATPFPNLASPARLRPASP